MKKLNLLNSLIFALALQLSASMVACDVETDANPVETQSYFTKKNAAIAAVTLVAGYELAKVYQVSNNINIKAFCKEVLELNKKDFSRVGSFFKNFGSSVKNNVQAKSTVIANGASYYGNKTLGYVKAPFNYVNSKRLEFLQKRQAAKTMGQLQGLASNTSKVAELDSNFIELINEFGRKCPLQIW